MATKFIHLLFLVTQLRAASIALTDNSTQTPATPSHKLESSSTPIPLDFEAELAKMSTSCMGSRDHEQLWRNAIKHTIARIYDRQLLRCAVEMIGQTEMREALGFAPRRGWVNSNWSHPSEAELATVSTMEAYYDLKEPRSKMCSLDSLFFYEKNITPGIEYLDTRFPFIRAHYKRKFSEIRRLYKEMIDRKVIDQVIVEFFEAIRKINNAIGKMLDRDYDEDCFGDL